VGVVDDLDTHCLIHVRGLIFSLGTYLDERLDFAPLGQLLLSHSFCYLQRITLDSSNDGVRERSILAPFVVLFDHHNLLPGVTSLKDNSDLRDTVSGEVLQGFESIVPTFPGL